MGPETFALGQREEEAGKRIMPSFGNNENYNESGATVKGRTDEKGRGESFTDESRVLRNAEMKG